MRSQTYKDIIDEKIAEWQQGIEKVQKMTERATTERRNQLHAKIAELKVAIDGAVVQLRDLDERETPENTMETKERILDIFSSVDKDLKEYQEKTPFML